MRGEIKSAPQPGSRHLKRGWRTGEGRERENCSKCWRHWFDWSNWNTQGTRSKVTGKGGIGMIPPLVTRGQQISKRKQRKVNRLVLENMWDTRGDCNTSLGRLRGDLDPADGVLRGKGIVFILRLAGVKKVGLSNDPWDVTVSDYQQL